MFMEIARVVSMRSTCQRKSVGAILVANNRIISIGYNGAPAGEPHCEGADCPIKLDGGCEKAVHAERNAIEHIPKGVIMGPGMDMYSTCSPCPDCADHINQSPITRFFYESTYRDMSGLAYLINIGINCYRVTPSGYVLQTLTKNSGSELYEMPTTLDS